MASTRSILIVGGSGFLGTHLALRLREGYKVFSTFYNRKVVLPGVTHIPFDLDEKSWAKRVIYVSQPDVVIYAAGYYSSSGILGTSGAHKKVDENSANLKLTSTKELSEKELRDADRLHTDGPATLATLTEIMQPKFIYLSHPYVFDGHKGNYHENDTISPSNLLGKMKSGGENVVKTKCLNYIVLRSSPLFGRGNGSRISFLDRLRMSLDRNQKCELSDQELHSFAPVEGLCEVVNKLIDSGLRNKLFHYGGLTRMTYFQFGQAFAKRFGYDSSLIVPREKRLTGESFSDTSALDFSLNSTQTIETLKIKPFFLEQGFDLIQKQLVSEF